MSMIVIFRLNWLVPHGALTGADYRRLNQPAELTEADLKQLNYTA